MVIIFYLAFTLLVLFATFVFFCAVMKLRDVRDKGLLQQAPATVKGFAYLTLFIGLILDVLLNVLLSIVLMELPCEWLTTARMARLKVCGTRWQRGVARWFCRHLDMLDDGHCNS